MDKETAIPFDQYQRYGVAARAIEALRSNGEPLNILEVGANTHKLLGRLLPNDRIVYLDREVPLEMQGQADIIVGDATELTLADASFDVVVALDVFEHIPAELRDAFLHHTSRVARLLTIIGAPFDASDVTRSEREASDYWDSLFDYHYRWLEEHAENGLPNLNNTLQTVASMGYHHHVLSHGEIGLWTALLKGHFAKEYVASLRPIVALFDKYYQNHLFAIDFSKNECYRQFIFCSRDSIVTQKIKVFFDELGKASNSETNHDFPLQLLKMLPSIAIEKKAMERQIAERDAEIADLHNSTSWRITRPMRFAASYIKSMQRDVGRVLLGIKHVGPINILKKAIRLYRNEGWAGIKRGYWIVAGLGGNDYVEWIQLYDTLTNKSLAKIRARINIFTHKPLISVVMPTYNPKPEWLIEAIESVRKQIYPYWELCIADDASTDETIRPILESYAKKDSRIKVTFREKNGHISVASNSALELVTGEWVALFDSEDLLSEHALFCVVDVINRNHEVSLIYSDEDNVDEVGRRHNPYFKCDWNLDLFYSHNFISHLGVYRTDILKKIGGFKIEMAGAQDYDLALRFIECIESKHTQHIPRVLYHSRMHAENIAQSTSTQCAMIAGQKALNEHLERLGLRAKAELTSHCFRVRYSLPDVPPLVSLIIPTKNGYELIKQCVDSILDKTTYPNYEIIIVDNGSDDTQTLKYFQTLESNPRIKILRDDRPFNYSSLNNEAVKHANGELIGLINNDIEVITPGWLTEMVSHATRPEVGAVGARLWYPDDTLQHGGVILVGGVAGHAHKGIKRGDLGYHGRADSIQSFCAVTAACLIVKKSLYQAVGGLNEEYLKVAFNDVDFCLRLLSLGYKNIWTPYAELYHHESATRGLDDTSEKKIRFEKEIDYMKKNWQDLLLYDPAYSPNLAWREDFSFAWPPRVVKDW